MEEIYAIWRNIKLIRSTTNNFVSTPFKLIAQEYTSDIELKETKFLLRNCEVTKTEDGVEND